MSGKPNSTVEPLGRRIFPLHSEMQCLNIKQAANVLQKLDRLPTKKAGGKASVSVSRTVNEVAVELGEEVQKATQADRP